MSRMTSRRMSKTNNAVGTPIETLHARVLDAVGEAVVATDMSGRLVYCNRAAAELYAFGQLDPHEQVTATLRAAITVGDREDLAVALAAASPWTGEVSLRRLSGREVPVLMTVTPVTDEAGTPTHVVTVVTDLTERKAAEARLARQALHDSLTGLPNRTLFHDRLAQALARASRGHGRVAVLYIDLDEFKLINDVYGHGAGDEVLRAAANLLESATRTGDIVARLGGDEFGVVCEPIPDAAEALATAQRLAAALDVPFGLRGHEITITTSIGIALSDDGVTDADQLLQDADIALYRAKEAGRDRVILFDDHLRAHSLRRIHLEEALRGALGAGELSLAYQPEVEIASGRLVGFEALLRWDHPILGSVPPDEFVPVAERSDLIHQIGKWVLDQAAQEAAVWQRLHPEMALKVSVNLSAKQLADARIIDNVREALATSELSPDRLCLEITESAVMDDARASAAMLHELKALGVELSIDDFGTGYSSLAYLKRFPVDFLKVDRTFVAGLGRDADDVVIVASVVELGRSLGVGVVAEGVETEEQLAQLRSIGCAQGQGYLWSHPLPSRKVPHVLDLAALEGIRTR